MKPYRFVAYFCRFDNQMKCRYIFKTFVFKNCGKVLIVKKSAESFEHFKGEHVERNDNNNLKYGGRKGMALPTFLNCHAINELMTFWTSLVKSCYWNSFLLSFQDNLLLFTFFSHYINMGVFILLI